MAGDTGLTELTACEVVDRLDRGEVTPLDCLDALEARIAAVDGAVNALPVTSDTLDQAWQTVYHQGLPDKVKKAQG